METSVGTRLWSYRDSAVVHLAVGALVCLFVLSPALFTPYGFGYDFTNHLWLIWQQGMAISNTGHPTLYLQLPNGIFEPFFGFYGGTLYSVAGAFSALLGNHPYPVYIASIGVAAALAYAGMWWLGRQLGLRRWVAHLPAFVVVTATYYLTDMYTRGAWPELVAISAVPMFLAGAVRLLTGPWKSAPVALFALATVVLTGSHNVTLLWSAILIGPFAVVVWTALRGERPPWRRILAVMLLTGLAAGINAWFLILDVHHSKETMAWIQNEIFLKEFTHYFYFDNLGTVLDPLRGTPAQSSTPGLAIAAPVAAFAFGLILTFLSRDRLRGVPRALLVLWWALLAAMGVLVLLMVMPGSWWISIGTPFTDIQFPYRLAAWLMIAVAVQLAIGLRFARSLSGGRRTIAIVLAGLLVLLTVVQASAQMYSAERLDGKLNKNIHPRTRAFVNGPSQPPDTWYDPYSYADSSLPEIQPAPTRAILLPTPRPGQTRQVTRVELPAGTGPIATNIAAGPYVARVVATDGLRVVGRTLGGMLVLDGGHEGVKDATVTIEADAGSAETLAIVVSLICLIAVLGAISAPSVRSRLRARRRESS